MSCRTMLPYVSVKISADCSAGEQGMCERGHRAIETTPPAFRQASLTIVSIVALPRLSGGDCDQVFRKGSSQTPLAGFTCQCRSTSDRRCNCKHQLQASASHGGSAVLLRAQVCRWPHNVCSTENLTAVRGRNTSKHLQGPSRSAGKMGHRGQAKQVSMQGTSRGTRQASVEKRA